MSIHAKDPVQGPGSVPDHPTSAASHLMQRRSARGGARGDSDHAAGIGRGATDSVSDHAVRSSERRARIDSRDAAGVGPCSGARTRVGLMVSRTMQPVRPRGGTGNDSVVAVEF